MKAYIDWLGAQGQVNTLEIPEDGRVFRPVDLGMPGGAASAEAALDFAKETRGPSINLLTHGSLAAFIDGQQILPGQARKLEHLEEIEWGTARLRYRREPAAPEMAGRAVEEISLDGLREGVVLIIGRGGSAAQTSSDGEEEIRVDLDPQDSAISRRHVEIRRESKSGRFIVSDVSTFGAMLNSRAFDSRPLVYGDRIQVRDYFFEFTGSSLRWVDGRVGGNIRARDLKVVVDSKGQKKIILQDVTVAINTGEFIGILGGSGQGKSTFMNALCGVNPATSGEVEIDGVQMTDRKQVKDLSVGFVPQDDLVHRELSVVDALRFSAKLRLRISPEEMDALVDGVIERLGLSEHRLKRVSNLSGGQRKRVSIATELLAKPSILFLDEPSSGLDPESERKLMEDLQALSLSGLTIVATTHVLATAKLLDRFCFIHAGRLVFIGRGPEVQGFISRLKALREETTTGRVVQEDISSHSHASSLGSESLGRRTEYEKIYEILGGMTEEGAAALREEFKNSPLGRHQEPAFPTPPPVVPRKKAKGGVGMMAALALLVRRQWKILAADRMNLWFVIAQSVIIGFLVGWVSDDNGFRLFLAMIATMWFGCSNAAQQIVSELPIYRRERVSGLGSNTYILSKFAFLSFVTTLQSLLLFAVLTISAAMFHPVDLPFDEFTKDLREGMRREAESTTEKPQVALLAPPDENDSGVIQIPDEIFEAPEEGILEKPLLPAWQERLLWVCAKYFLMEMNLQDSRGREISLLSGSTYMSQGINVWQVVAICVGFRLAAMLGAALVGVALGLAVSSIAQSATQAVLWVPLILIPQILLGGFVVTLSEMNPAVRYFSMAMPSAASQRVLDVANIYGQRVPKMTNLTRIPSFLSNEKGKRGEETIEWYDMQAKLNRRSTFDKISPYNTAWQNLVIDHSRVGQHEQESSLQSSGVSEQKPRTTDRRGDVPIPRHTLYQNLQPALNAFLVLGAWFLGCYAVISVALIRKQYGK